MLVDSGNSAAGSAVTGAIRQASQATGMSLNYLLATAQVESGLNPHAGASTSSARGLFQFIDKTWLATMKQAGPALGYGQYAAAITKNASGHYEVRDPSLRSEILKLRSDPTANAVMAGAFTKANASVLSERLGRSPSEGELYIAHFLGAGGQRNSSRWPQQIRAPKPPIFFPMRRRPTPRFSTIGRPALPAASRRSVIFLPLATTLRVGANTVQPSPPRRLLRRRPPARPRRRRIPRALPAPLPPPFQRPKQMTSRSSTACSRMVTAPRRWRRS